MAQNDEIPEIVLQVEEMNVEDLEIRDCQRLMQVFYDLKSRNSPHAHRVQLILKRVMLRFSGKDLKIQ